MTYKNRDADSAIRVNYEIVNHVSTMIAREKGIRLLLGCHIGVMKRIFGGSSGNSGGKDNRALKKPPSLQQKDKTITKYGQRREVLHSSERTYYNVSGGLHQKHRTDGQLALR